MAKPRLDAKHFMLVVVYTIHAKLLIVNFPKYRSPLLSVLCDFRGAKT